MACVFLAAIDQVICPAVCPSETRNLKYHQTIVATALPTIVSQLGGGSGYSWVGRSVQPLAFTSSCPYWPHISAYLLAAARWVCTFDPPDHTNRATGPQSSPSIWKIVGPHWEEANIIHVHRGVSCTSLRNFHSDSMVQFFSDRVCALRCCSKYGAVYCEPSLTCLG